MRRDFRNTWGLVALGVLLACSACSSTAFPGRGGQDRVPDGLRAPSGMVPIKQGTFKLGSVRGAGDEVPVRAVSVPPFHMHRTEVSHGAYAQCVAARACRAPRHRADAALPVTSVTWHDARAYCAWIGGRLPSEIEWEYAARGEEGRVYPWGATFVAKRANSADGIDGYPHALAPVTAFAEGASPFGVLNLAGNAAEWTADVYDATWYARRPAGGVKGSPAPSDRRVVRGGGYTDSAYELRASHRSAMHENAAKTAVGFRCVSAGGPAARDGS